MVINENCKVCQIKRNIDKYPLNATEEEIKEYQYKVKKIVENSDGLSTPQVAEKWMTFGERFWKCNRLY